MSADIEDAWFVVVASQHQSGMGQQGDYCKQVQAGVHGR